MTEDQLVDRFQCQTCSECFRDPLSAQKHLSATRHKSIKLCDTDEILECEECSDRNIHQLAILRYGLNDMSLLCSECLGKDDLEEEEPSAKYTLSNGAILVKLDQYLKFRDLECTLCGAGSKLYVGNTSRGQVATCKNCLPQYESQKINFVSEDDDRFLTELLGIKDFVPKASTEGGKRGRGRGGRLGGKGRSGGRPPRRAKKEDPDAEARRAHYQESKQNALDIKSGSMVKAIGSVNIGGLKKFSPEKSSSKFSAKKKPSSGKDGSGPGPGKGPAVKANGSRSSPSPRVDKDVAATARASNDNKASLLKKSEVKRTGTKKPEAKREKSQVEGQVAETHPVEQQGGSEKSLQPKKNNDSKKQRNQSEPSSKQAKQGKQGKSKPGNNTTLDSRDAASNGEAMENSQSKNRKSQSPSIKNKSSSSVVSNGSDQAKNKDKNKDKDNSRNKNKDKDSSESDLVIPPYITKYHPSSTLKLSYDNLDEYFREVSFNIFLEDQLTNVSSIIEPKDLMIEWFADQDKKNTQYKVSIPMTPEVADRFISDRFKKLKRDPFQKDQAMFLILDDDVPWYGRVATVDGIKTGKNKRTAKIDYFSLVIQLYSWNNQPLPKTVHAQHLKLLPASVPVSRIFNAMDSISNPSFIKMLLGKEPIKQIYFNNRINFSSNLNDSQRAAIQSVLNNKISVVRGPPGTGKTSAIYETIIQLLESLNTYPILVVAASNIAIDNIAEKLLAKHGKSILRITASEKEKEYDRLHPLAGICLHHKIYDALPLKLQQVQNDLKRGTGAVSANAYKNFMQEKFQITKQQVAQAKVLLTTTVVAGGPQLKSVSKCPVVIMDEATQSSEPSTLIPLAVPGVDKFVFVGDQKQLSCFSLIPALSTSLFERVLLNGTYKAPHMLNTQYRMHPAISEFPRTRFYGGELKDGIDAKAREMNGIPANPVYFWDTAGKAREQSVRNYLREDRGYTFYNRDEVWYVQQILRVLILEKGISRDQIGVVTPYSGQRDLISSILVKDEVVNPTNEEMQVEVDIDDIRNDSKPVTIHIVSGIMIASIDAFQGREKNFMVMSCVRSNAQGTIGFLRDERRLNVALTRAKYGLIMVGDVSTLKRGDQLWREYIEYLQSKNSIHGGDRFEYL
ncbi:uncharacterized protein LODBEIA_P17480 [Lodderomyces beijingensis]|uniref:C2H2-type domain-containing protein n=1 Tax=Lodderomyces beijingensis TaxID=1775926 RepID=A0ABP0ZH85_9ASCO